MVCDKFRKRFMIMEELAQNDGKFISDYTFALDSFWDIAKKMLNASATPSQTQQR